jgi:multiple sugar transport system permease protein
VVIGMAQKNTWKISRIMKKIPFFLLVTLASLFSFWPIMIMFLEGTDADLSPIFSGQGIRFIGGVPYYSGGIYPTLIHYIDAISLNAFPRLALNSAIIALSSVVIALAAGIPAGYGLARLKFKGQAAIAYSLLALRTVSPFAIVIPLYILFTQNGLWDTYLGLAIAYLVIDVPVVVWMLRGLFSDVPKETYDAAEVFGATESQIFRRIALPSIVLGIVATAIFAIVLIWNEFLLANMLTGPVTKTVSVGIWNGMGDQIGFRSVDFDSANAAGFLAFLPAVALFLIIKRYLAKGFTLATAS